MNYNLPFNSLKDLHSFYSDYLIQNFTLSNNVSLNNLPRYQNFVQNSLSNIGINDFYLTNTISETSKVMQECSQNRTKVNFN